MKVCDSCFRDEEIISFIRVNSSESGICDACSANGQLIDLSELLDYFMSFLSIFRYDEDGEDIDDLIQKDWGIFQSNDVCTRILTDSFLKVEVALSLGIALNMLTEGVDLKVKYLVEIEDNVSYWQKLKEDLKWKRRYLTDVDEMIELGWDGFFNDSFKIDAGSVLYRARINEELQSTPYSSDKMLSPPVRNTTAGRANPQGIPFLYLSKEIDTTLYETRATFFDNISVGYFKVVDDCELNIVDFTSRQSTFNHIDDMKMFVTSKLLRKEISEDLSKPLRRYDSELEYIPTQFICEFIRYISKADGIQFKSSLRRDGLNIVLFNQENIICSKVELFQITDIAIRSEKIKY
jgi:hypothetical protein